MVCGIRRPKREKKKKESEVAVAGFSFPPPSFPCSCLFYINIQQRCTSRYIRAFSREKGTRYTEDEDERRPNGRRTRRPFEPAPRAPSRRARLAR